MAGIGIVTNPHSKLNKRNPERATLLGYILGEQGVVETTNSLEELAKVATQFRDKNIDVLAINGGDGTISRTLTAFFKAYGDRPLPKIALLRGGTMNVIATNLGIWGSPEKILYQLVEAHSSGQSFKTDTLSVLKIGEQFGFLFGTGVIAGYLRLYYQNKSGPVGAVLLILKLIFAFVFNKRYFLAHMKDQDVEFASQEHSGTCRSVSVLCSTVERMPLGPKVFPFARLCADKMQCNVLKFGIDRILIGLFAALVKNRPQNTRMKLIWTPATITLKSSESIDYTIDGELFVHQANAPLEITCCKRLEFILP